MTKGLVSTRKVFRIQTFPTKVRVALLLHFIKNCRCLFKLLECLQIIETKVLKRTYIMTMTIDSFCLFFKIDSV